MRVERARATADWGRDRDGLVPYVAMCDDGADWSNNVDNYLFSQTVRRVRR